MARLFRYHLRRFSGAAGPQGAQLVRGDLDRRPVAAGDGDVAHLATGAGLALAVEVQVHPRQGQGAGPVRRAVLPQIPEQVEQDGGLNLSLCRQRQIAQGAHLQLELAATGVVDAGMAELWGRGAISLTSSWPPTRKNSTVSTPT